MADSDLLLQNTALYTEVADLLGYTRDDSNHTTEMVARIQKAMDKGYADFIGEHDWTFLRKYATIVTTAPYSTGTIAVTNDDATVTLSDGTWPSWAAQGSLYYDGVEYDVSSRTDDTHIELLDNFTGTTASGETYELRRLYYDLPDDFASVCQWFTFSSEHTRGRLSQTSYSRIQLHRAGNVSTTYPEEFAVLPKVSDGSADQKYRAMFFPLADGTYQLFYSYYIMPTQKVDGNATYAVGGPEYSQAIQDCMLSAARV